MIVATAGHVDHGKTSLVRALTGVDTDRLAEEKARGLTIELGFAYRDVDGGRRIGFVDVPGHERFVHTMLAGAGGVDAALLVVAADDGVMPQTREHTLILELLGVRSGAVAIAKADRVDAARVDAVAADVRTLLRGTGLERAGIFPVSSLTGAGVDDLWSYLTALAASYGAQRMDAPFRMPVDRAFTLQGAGLVLTGTAVAGRLKTGDRLTVQPDGTPVRVRGIHALNRKADEGHAGQRLGINVTGADVGPDRWGRGFWLVSEDAVRPTQCLDVLARVPADAAKPFSGRGRFHLHLGTADVITEARVLAAAPIAPGEAGFLRLRTEAPVVAVRGERAILRDASASRTVAGAEVIDPEAPPRKRRGEDRLAALDAMAAATPDASLAAQLALPEGIVEKARFARAWQLPTGALTRVAADAGASDAGEWLVSETRLDALGAAIRDRLAAWHRDRPEEAGLDLGRVSARLPGNPPGPVADAAIARLIGAGAAVRRATLLALPGHKAAFAGADAALWKRIEPMLAAGGRVPPRVHEIAQAVSLPGGRVGAFLRRAVRLGYLHPVAENRFFPGPALADLAAVAADLGSFDARSFKDAAGIGRNLAIEILEYFDKVGVTRREGDIRHAVDGGAEQFSGD